MSASSIFVSRIRNHPVLDAEGGQIGKIRDVVIYRPVPGEPARAKGLVVELFSRHRIFVPMNKLRSITTREVIIAGLVDTRKFVRRVQERLIVEDLFDRQVTLKDESQGTIYDVSLLNNNDRYWQVDQFAVLEHVSHGLLFGRKQHIKIVPWEEITNRNIRMDITGTQDTSMLLAQMEDMNSADIALELNGLTPERRTEIVRSLDDKILADAIEELPEKKQVEIIMALDPERAADVLEEMDPDDAADLVSDLTDEKAEDLLTRMENDDAEDIRQLLEYEEKTAGGMMNPEPVILGPETTVSEALARIRNIDLNPSEASMVYVCRSPLDTPTGRFLGVVHFQRLLREPPSQNIGLFIDNDLQPLPPNASLATVSRYFATYNLVSAPVVDSEKRLLGAVTVDDVLDHLLPHDWRNKQMQDIQQN